MSNAAHREGTVFRLQSGGPFVAQFAFALLIRSYRKRMVRAVRETYRIELPDGEGLPHPQTRLGQPAGAASHSTRSPTNTGRCVMALRSYWVTLASLLLSTVIAAPAAAVCKSPKKDM